MSDVLCVIALAKTVTPAFLMWFSWRFSVASDSQVASTTHHALSSPSDCSGQPASHGGALVHRGVIHGGVTVTSGRCVVKHITIQSAAGAMEARDVGGQVHVRE